MKNFSQSILLPSIVPPRNGWNGNFAGPPVAKRVGVSGLFPEFREGFGWRTLARGGLVTGWSKGRKRRECIFRSTRVPAGSPSPAFSTHRRQGTSHSATSSRDLIMQSGGPLRPFALSSLFFFSLSLSLPRLRSRPLSLPGHVGGPSSPLTFRGKPHLRIFIGIIPARLWKLKVAPRLIEMFFVIFFNFLGVGGSKLICLCLSLIRTILDVLSK